MKKIPANSPVSPSQARLTFIGCLLLAVSMSAFGLSLANIQTAALESMNGLGSFSLITTLCSAALCVMTPIGGSLMDMIGIKKVVLIFGLATCLCALALVFTTNLYLYMILRILLSAAQGAFASVPFVEVRKLYPVNKVPTMTGYLSGALALGGFLGSWMAGWFLDHQMIGLASCFPVILVAGGIFMIYRFGPADSLVKRKMDVLGIFLLALTLLGLSFALNDGPVFGWTSTRVWIELAIFLAGLAGLAGLLYWEKKCSYPLIPLYIFKNGAYDLLLIIAALLVVYLTAINVYVPQALQKLMGQPASISGTVQIPRTILSVIVPGIAGAWVARKTGNTWRALAVSAVLLIVSCSCLVFIGPRMPIWFVFAVLALTGAADSFRTVATMPAAQSLLQPQDLGVGTSMVGFVISLSGVLASAIYSIAYNSLIQATPGDRGLTDGIDTVLLISAACALIAFVLDVFFFRKMYVKALDKAHPAMVANPVSKPSSDRPERS